MGLDILRSILHVDTVDMHIHASDVSTYHTGTRMIIFELNVIKLI